MGRRIRVWQPNTVYTATIRCSDRKFLLKPDHHPRTPLLAADCPPNAFDIRNDHIPKPSVINIIGAAVARAQQLHPIRIHWVEVNINHMTVGYSVDANQLANISDFFRTADSIIARMINVKWEHEGHVWSSPFRASACVDEKAAEQQLIYCLTNPVKDCLVSTVRESPFFTSYRALAHGKQLRFWRIDWNRFHLAGSFRKMGHRPKDYLEWLEIQLDPLPHQATWPEHRRQAWIRAAVRDVEHETADSLRFAGRKPMGATAQYRVEPRDRPITPNSSGPQPLCHASSREARLEYARQWRAIKRAHRAASIDYRMGHWGREFPEGTFRPPLTKPFGSELRL